jgi:hypothetical protein
LPNLAQSVDAGDGAAGFAASAAYTIDELGDYVKELAFFCQLIDLFFYFWGFEVFYGQFCPPLVVCSMFGLG